jgi:hypothetical protein
MGTAVFASGPILPKADEADLQIFELESSSAVLNKVTTWLA